MTKTILMGVAALIVMSGANMTAFAQRIPGRGLQQAAYMNAKQLNNLSQCGAGGCATAPPNFGGCADEPGGCKIGCGERAPISCRPLKHIPIIIPSIPMPNCASPAPCLNKLGSMIGRAFVKADPECKPTCIAPTPSTPAPCSPGSARIMGPGVASICDAGTQPCDCNATGSGCDTGNCNTGACNSGNCETGNCNTGNCNSGACNDGRCQSGGSVCSGLGSVCGSGLCGSGACSGGLCGAARFSLFPDTGWNMPVKTPITRNPVSYSRYQPGSLYGSPGHGYSGNFPMIYRPTDTTQLGFISHNVPYWKRTRSPSMPAPSAIHNRNCPTGGYSAYGQGYNPRSHHSYPWFQHHTTDVNQPGASAAYMAARRPTAQPVRRPVMAPARTAAKPNVMQAGFRKSVRR